LTLTRGRPETAGISSVVVEQAISVLLFVPVMVVTVLVFAAVIRARSPCARRSGVPGLRDAGGHAPAPSARFDLVGQARAVGSRRIAEALTDRMWR
jgi:hypothetical protein